jgi:uncharacterized glyoxalase superfamily protein PhnB
MQSLGMFALVVPDYDEAISYYQETLRFSLIEDTPLDPQKRWVVMSPGIDGARVLLAKASNPTQTAIIGDQFGGRVGLFLYTTDFGSYYNHLRDNDVEFETPPRDETYGRVVVFRDRYGNRWDLIERKGN